MASSSVAAEVGSTYDEVASNEGQMQVDATGAMVPEEPEPEARPMPKAKAKAAFRPRERDEVYWMRSTSEWTEQCSLHLSHIEGRLMEGEYEAHEAVRQFGIHLEGFCPEPRGDWGWMLRKCRDVAVRAVRQLMKVYGGGDIEEKYTVVRLLLEEAFHRMLMGFEGDPMRQRGLCSMMVTFKEIEEGTIGDVMGQVGDLGLFSSMTRQNVGRIAMAVEGGQSTLRDMPSFEAVANFEVMKHEVFSLLPVRMTPTSLRMTVDEVRHVVNEVSHRPLREDEEVLGVEGPSMFEQFFAVRAEEEQNAEG